MPEVRPKSASNVARWRRFFDRQADELGAGIAANGYFNPKTFHITRDAILSLLAGQSGRKILDVGCGNGRMLEPLTSEHHVHGVDVSDKMCALALAAGYRTATRGDCEHIEHESDGFDVAISCGIVQLLPTADRAVAELTRVTRPGGQVIVVTVNDESLLRRLFKEKYYVRAYRVSELVGTCERLGLEHIEIVPLFFPFSLRYRVRRPSLPTRWAMASFVLKGIKP